MTRSIACAGALAAALLVFSTGAAAAQSADGLSSGALDSSSLTGSAGTETDADTGGGLGSAGDLLPASVTGSLPGYTSGPVGSVASAVCGVGTVAGAAANLAGIPLPPIGVVCMVVKPVAESVDFLMRGDVPGSVDAVIGGVPVVGGSLAGAVDTGSATDAVEGSLGEERLGSITGSSVSPEGSPEIAPAN
ncbi:MULTISPECIES: hypothetical protein [unclassified Dietzia]|uniref:hypothetical protein n=1 Tax=unclassified Dietzia TaxID=2617939 RepID=UPI000D2134BD|nr:MULTISPECIES: hypothetical protein [unclassified Dietzia]AVZ39199.1 hypothetical protein CT688_06675 [Dietzia sp. JS16-p6b]QGW24424.1 hypothetical protein GJR88_02143 [Dietzia sp. DQ12-45-1b]